MSSARSAAVAALLCALSALSAVSGVRAQSVRLEWLRPVASTCPTARVLQQDVEALLGQPVFTSGSPLLRVRGRIDEQAQGAAVILEARDARGVLLGSRALETERGECASLRGAIALALGLLIERQLPPAAVEAAPELRFGLEAALLLGSLPRADAGVGPTLVLSLGMGLRMQLSAAFYAPVGLESTRGIRATLHSAALTARFCARLAASGEAHALYVCAGIQLAGWWTLQSRGGTASELRAQLHGLLELRGAVRVFDARRLELAVAPLVAIDRLALYSIHGDDGQRVLLHRTPALGLLFAVEFVI